MKHLNQIVMTGGPGSGKSTLLSALAHAGYAVSAEVGRAIIQEQVALDSEALPWRQPLLFAQAMMARERVRHEQLPQGLEPVFLDRGWLDVIGYLRLMQLNVPEDMLALGHELARYQQVFILPPWAQIYTQDTERTQDFEVAIHTYEVMREVYTEHGYDLIDVPKGSVAERQAFILSHLR